MSRILFEKYVVFGLAINNSLQPNHYKTNMISKICELLRAVAQLRPTLTSPLVRPPVQSIILCTRSLIPTAQAVSCTFNFPSPTTS